MKRRALFVMTVLLLLVLAGDTAKREVRGNPGNAEGSEIAPAILTRQTYAFFEKESYVPSSVATLVVKASSPKLELQVYQSGPEGVVLSHRKDTMNGVPVGEPLIIQWQGAGAPTGLRYWIGDWRSGFYYLEIRTGSEVTYAPFIIRPVTLGQNRVAVVLPTNTWQAYNYYDMNADGVGDTWYARWDEKFVPLDRPYLDNGVPRNFKRYDLPFLLWLARHEKSVDVLADADLERVSGDELAAAYDLIVFSGHTEYVTDMEYDAVVRYRDLGGNLIFLSANNFFWRVEKEKGMMRRTAQWRNLGRPEAALIGVQYRANDRGARRGGFLVQDPGIASWLWEGIEVSKNSRFGKNFGIEIDARSPASPAGTRVLAMIPNLFGRGLTAEMSYYETSAGAKVFAAGAFTLAGAGDPLVDRLLVNLWDHLVSP